MVSGVYSWSRWCFIRLGWQCRYVQPGYWTGDLARESIGRFRESGISSIGGYNEVAEYCGLSSMQICLTSMIGPFSTMCLRQCVGWYETIIRGLIVSHYGSRIAQNLVRKLYWSTSIHKCCFTVYTADALNSGITVLGNDIVPFQSCLRGGRIPRYLLEPCGRDQTGGQTGHRC